MNIPAYADELPRPIPPEVRASRACKTMGFLASPAAWAEIKTERANTQVEIVLLKLIGLLGL
jgi:hypothetical protein